MKYLSIILIAQLWTTVVLAADDFEKIEVLDHPRYTLNNRFTLDVDLAFLPLDGYYKPLFLEAATSYQWDDFISWEILRAGYSLYNHDTGLKKGVQNALTASGSSGTIADSPLHDMRYHVSSAVFMNILYSKSNFFNDSVIYHYWQVGGGLSYYNMKKDYQVGIDLEMRVRFFLNEHTTLNIRGGHTIGTSSDVPDNITFLGVGVGLAF
jgi:hypothetical protein